MSETDDLRARVKALEWWAFGGVTIETPEEHAAVNKIRAIQVSTRALVNANWAVKEANAIARIRDKT